MNTGVPAVDLDQRLLILESLQTARLFAGHRRYSIYMMEINATHHGKV
jgi:hypothetical protein